MEEAEALYRDFASQPHKTNEVEVFAAYYVMRALLEGNDEDLWWECLRETEERGYDNDAVFAAVSRLEKEFRDALNRRSRARQIRSDFRFRLAALHHRSSTFGGVVAGAVQRIWRPSWRLKALALDGRGAAGAVWA